MQKRNIGQTPVAFSRPSLDTIKQTPDVFGMKTQLVNPEAGAELSRESTLLHVSSALGRFVGMVCFQCLCFRTELANLPTPFFNLRL